MKSYTILEKIPFVSLAKSTLPLMVCCSDRGTTIQQ
jgi:hypothetical protein